MLFIHDEEDENMQDDNSEDNSKQESTLQKEVVQKANETYQTNWLLYLNVL